MARSPGKKVAPKKAVKVDEPKYLCHHCLGEKKKKQFYTSTDPNVMTGITSICRDCVRKIALGWDENRQEYGACNKKTVMQALEYVDKPFLDTVWDASYNEWANTESNNRRASIWDCYIKNIAMPQYRGMRWRDGDLFTTYIEDAKEAAALELGQEDKAQTLINSQEVGSEFEKNRKDVIRLLGYDPFEGEKLEDQPLLYSQLIGYLDTGGDGNEDMMRTSSAITIVRGFLQQSKLDDKIAKAMINTNVNASELKTMLDAKQKISSTISQLAEQSCLSLKHNKNASKGENTWTGKIKKLRDMNLRENEINAFDIGTCEGMMQVADISNASILKQIRLDENDYTEMLAEQRDMIAGLRKQSMKDKERSRLLLQENYDLKKLLSENNIDVSDDMINFDLLEDFNANDEEELDDNI